MNLGIVFPIAVDTTATDIESDVITFIINYLLFYDHTMFRLCLHKNFQINMFS